MPHTTTVSVRWGDTDAAGLIYYPRFFHFFVVALNDYFAGGTDAHPMDALRQDGYALPAVDATASFETPLRAGDTARVRTTVEDVGETSLTVSFAITRRDDGARAAQGEVSFVLVDDAFEPAPLPESMREQVREHGDAST